MKPFLRKYWPLLAGAALVAGLLLLAAWSFYTSFPIRTTSGETQARVVKVEMGRLATTTMVTALVTFELPSGAQFQSHQSVRDAKKIALDTPFTLWRVTEHYGNGGQKSFFPDIEFPQKP